MNIEERIELTKQTLDAMERCRNGVPDGYRLECKSSFSDWGGAPTNPAWGAIGYRLVELPKPKRVPLERSDVIVHKTVIRIGDDADCGVTAASANGVAVTEINDDSCTARTMYYAFEELVNGSSATYSNDGGATWQHCSKVVP